jgi:beta-lactamase class D
MDLTQLQDLMTKCGLSTEASTKICESINSYLASAEKKLNEDYRDRIEKAKKICLEETSNHKIDLARRVQTFFEATVNRIESKIAKDTVAKDTEALTKLAGIRDMLAGLPLGGDQQIQAENAQLKKNLNTLTEQFKDVKRVLKNKSDVLEKVITRNRLLEDRNKQRSPAGTVTVTESTKPVQKTTRYDAERTTTTKPASSRATLNENQNRQPVKDKRTSNVTANQMINHQLTPDQVADQISEHI